MSKGARNRRIRMFAVRNISSYHPEHGNNTVKSFARHIRRSGRKVKLG